MKLEELKPPLRDLIGKPEVAAEVKRRFRTFLTTFASNESGGRPLYLERIKEMCSENRQTLEVSYLHLSHMVPVLAIWVADFPAEILPLLHEVAGKVVLTQFERCATPIYVFVCFLDPPPPRPNSALTTPAVRPLNPAGTRRSTGACTCASPSCPSRTKSATFARLT